MSNENNDFSPPALDAAIAMHELFITFMQAGFTENQAIRIVVEMVKGTLT